MVIDNLCFHFLLDTGHSLAREIRSYISIEFWDRLLGVLTTRNSFSSNILVSYMLVTEFGICTAVVIVIIFSQKRLKSMESMLKPKTDAHPRLFGEETKIDIKVKIDGIEKLTEEEFDNLITMMKSLRRTLLEKSKNLSKCSGCGNAYYSKPKYCSNCGLELASSIPLNISLIANAMAHYAQ